MLSIILGDISEKEKKKYVLKHFSKIQNAYIYMCIKKFLKNTLEKYLKVQRSSNNGCILWNKAKNVQELNVSNLKKLKSGTWI